MERDVEVRKTAGHIIPAEILRAMVASGGTDITVFVSHVQNSSTWNVRTVYDILQPDKNINIVYNSFEDIPEFLGSKIATLSLLDSGELLKGVGMRGKDNSYWVIVAREDVYDETNGLVQGP